MSSKKTPKTTKTTEVLTISSSIYFWYPFGLSVFWAQLMIRSNFDSLCQFQVEKPCCMKPGLVMHCEAKTLESAPHTKIAAAFPPFNQTLVGGQKRQTSNAVMAVVSVSEGLAAF